MSNINPLLEGQALGRDKSWKCSSCYCIVHSHHFDNVVSNPWKSSNFLLLFSSFLGILLGRQRGNKLQERCSHSVLEAFVPTRCCKYPKHVATEPTPTVCFSTTSFTVREVNSWHENVTVVHQHNQWYCVNFTYSGLIGKKSIMLWLQLILF